MKNVEKLWREHVFLVNSLDQLCQLTLIWINQWKVVLSIGKFDLISKIQSEEKKTNNQTTDHDEFNVSWRRLWAKL